MSFNTCILFIGYILSCLLAVVIHEIIHFITASFCKLNPSLILDNWAIPKVVFKNAGNDYKNLLVACLAPICLITLGVAIHFVVNAFVVFQFMCLTNILNLLPVSSDGEIIYLSIGNIFSKRKAAK
ncbi:metalloprotease family protein [Oenococcus sicerae]|uniref:DUF3267 domain-containing protein n=1 Tax=Oenococcus sicerae TaxID=2203724 RepID=A0AAJ1RAU3_9LACO|nr:metalloprotease family protein [Oenococcus sicerae]MDN6900193.1 hypothetical protein [Oenococcus sicerae]